LLQLAEVSQLRKGLLSLTDWYLAEWLIPFEVEQAPTKRIEFNMSKNLAEWDRLIASETNTDIKKLMHRKMKAGVSPAKFKAALQKWRNAQTRKIKKQFKRDLRAL
jgi:hypothetical protein